MTGTIWALQPIYTKEKEKERKETPTRTPTRQSNWNTARTKSSTGVACKGASSHHAYHNPRTKRSTEDSTPEHTCQREDLTERGQNKLESELGDLHGAPTHTRQRGRDERPSQELNGRKEEEKKEAKPNTEVGGRQEEERDEKRKQKTSCRASHKPGCEPGPKT